MTEAVSKGAYYVGESVTRLKAMIAERHGLTPEHVLLSSGSSGALTYAASFAAQSGAILGPDLFWDTTVRMALRQGGELKRTAKTPNLAIDLKAMDAAVTDEVAMVQITNPNNPTGMLLEAATLKSFCRTVSKRCMVLVDEAYNELTDQPDENTAIPLIKQGYDVMVARTFSKIYGLAGMRVGYLLADPARIAEVRQFALGDYSLNQAGIAAAVASYNDEQFLAYSKAKINAGKEMLTEALTANGLKALPSATNFMFVDLAGQDAESFRAAMQQKNVFIRGTYQDYHNWSRVSMGREEDLARYVAALPYAMDSASKATAAT